MAKMADDDGNDQMYLLSGDTHPVAWDRKKITHNSRSTSDLLEHAMQFEVKKIQSKQDKGWWCDAVKLREWFQVDLMVIIIKWFQVDQKLEFPRNRLMLDETIGEGEFGRVPFDVLYFDVNIQYFIFWQGTIWWFLFYILV